MNAYSTNGPVTSWNPSPMSCCFALRRNLAYGCNLPGQVLGTLLETLYVRSLTCSHSPEAIMSPVRLLTSVLGAVMDVASAASVPAGRSEEHTAELQSPYDF